MKTDLQAAHKLLAGALCKFTHDNTVGFVHAYDIHSTNKVIASLLVKIKELEEQKKLFRVVKSEADYENAMRAIENLMSNDTDEVGVKMLEALADWVELFEAKNIGGDA